MAVQSIFEELHLQPLRIDLGEVELIEKSIDNKLPQLCKKLTELGFEIIDSQESKLLEKIKLLLIEAVNHPESIIGLNLSTFLSNHLHQEYSALSKLFSEIEGITLEHYFIRLKIEKVKELLLYNEMRLNEIADFLNYSSVAHLSAQFKKITGFSPRYFKQLKENKRKYIDRL
jgi:AraC-like DNA-binding protein